MSQVRGYALDAVKLDSADSASGDDLAILAGADYAGGAVSSDDVHIRRMLLCHDQYDRTGERFPKAYLDRFAETIPGKSVMPMHDTGGWCGGGSMPVARFFNAGVERRTEDAFPVLVTDLGKINDSGTSGGPIPGFAPQKTRVQYLSCAFYFEADPATEPFRKRIDLGVYKHVSIGFRFDDITCDICRTSYLTSDCPHILMRPDQDAKRLCTGTYSGDVKQVEALEGSIVYLGAQPRARLMKALRTHEPIDTATLAMTPFGEDLVALKEVEFEARRRGHVQKAWAFPATLKAVPVENVPVDENDDDFDDATEPEAEKAVTEDEASKTDVNAAPPGGEAFEAQLVAALGAVRDCRERAEAVLALRDEKGARFSRARYEQVRTLAEEITSFADVLRVKSEPPSSRLAALRLRALAEEAALL